MFKEHKNYCYIISNDGWVNKVKPAEAEEKVDNKRWFYTTKSVYKHTDKGRIKINNTTMIQSCRKKDYITKDYYMVLYVMYPPKNVNWDKIIKRNKKQEEANLLPLIKHRQFVVIPATKYESLEAHQQKHYSKVRYRGEVYYKKVISHF